MRPPHLRTLVLLSLVACKPEIPEPIWKGDMNLYGFQIDSPASTSDVLGRKQRINAGGVIDVHESSSIE